MLNNINLWCRKTSDKMKRAKICADISAEAITREDTKIQGYNVSDGVKIEMNERALRR